MGKWRAQWPGGLEVEGAVAKWVRSGGQVD